MVDEMNARLDALGVATGDRYSVLTFASLVQREAGPNTADFAKIARVFRIDLTLNGTWIRRNVSYGTGNLTRYGQPTQSGLTGKSV